LPGLPRQQSRCPSRRSVTKLTNSSVIAREEILDQKGPACDVIEQEAHHSWMKPLPDPIINLDKDGRRYDERLGGPLDEPQTRSMMRITAIQRGIQRASVEN